MHQWSTTSSSSLHIPRPAFRHGSSTRRGHIERRSFISLSRCQKPQQKHQRSSCKLYATVHGLHLLESFSPLVPASKPFAPVPSSMCTASTVATTSHSCRLLPPSSRSPHHNTTTRTPPKPRNAATSRLFPSRHRCRFNALPSPLSHARRRHSRTTFTSFSSSFSLSRHCTWRRSNVSNLHVNLIANPLTSACRHHDSC